MTKTKILVPEMPLAILPPTNVVNKLLNVIAFKDTPGMDVLNVSVSTFKIYLIALLLKFFIYLQTLMSVNNRVLVMKMRFVPIHPDISSVNVLKVLPVME